MGNNHHVKSLLADLEHFIELVVEQRRTGCMGRKVGERVVEGALWLLPVTEWLSTNARVSSRRANLLFHLRTLSRKRIK